MAVKFATYNIQYGFGQGGQYDLSRIADAVGGNDIICLQEVTTNWPVCNGDNQPEVLMSGLNMYGVYAPAFEIDGSGPDADGKIINRRGGFGNMVLSRWPILYSRPHSLPRPKTEIGKDVHPKIDFPRMALETLVLADGIPLRVISVHLSHLPGGQQMAQVNHLLKLVDGLPQELPLWEDHPSINAWTGGNPAPPVVPSTLIFGDFNFLPEDEEYTAMTSTMIDGWRVADEKSKDEQTCTHSDGSITRLDYLFATPDLGDKIKSARVDQTITASDHFPVYFEIE